MKRIAFALVLASAAIAAFALESAMVGRIDYIEGGVTISRVGKNISDPNIDDPLLSGDLITTGADGSLVIAVDQATGMNGTITVKSNAALYLKLAMVKGQPRTSIDLLAGSIGSKVTKIAGTPTMNVSTSGAIMGVRGTEYGVAVSVNDSIMVVCTEGQVAVNDGSSDYPVPAGKAIEKKAGQAIQYLPVAISSVQEFTDRWIADEIEAFKADAPRALASYAQRYNDLSTRFAAAYDPFQKSATLRKWLDEDRSGAKINPLDPTVLREKKEMAGYLLDIRKVLFLFERVYYREDQLAGLVIGTPYESTPLQGGGTIRDFLNRVKTDRENLTREVARFRYAERLFEARSPEGDVFSSTGDDFFKSPDGF